MGIGIHASVSLQHFYRQNLMLQEQRKVCDSPDPLPNYMPFPRRKHEAYTLENQTTLTGFLQRNIVNLRIGFRDG